MLGRRARLMWSMQLDDFRMHRTCRGRSNCVGVAGGHAQAAQEQDPNCESSRVWQPIRRGKTVTARAACGPPCESSSARDAGDNDKSSNVR